MILERDGSRWFDLMDFPFETKIRSSFRHLEFDLMHAAYSKWIEHMTELWHDARTVNANDILAPFPAAAKRFVVEVATTITRGSQPKKKYTFFVGVVPPLSLLCSYSGRDIVRCMHQHGHVTSRECINKCIFWK